MNISRTYARALYELIASDANKGSAYIKNLQGSLARRGHQKLLPHILSEYQKLETAKSRKTMYETTTPEQERTRVLMQLYRKLIA